MAEPNFNSSELGAGYPHVLTPPPTNNQNPIANPPPSRPFHRTRDVPGLRDTDIDIPNIPDIEHTRSSTSSNQQFNINEIGNPSKSPLPLQPFQPNWTVGHPLPWNAYYPTHPDIEQSPFLLGVGREG